MMTGELPQNSRGNMLAPDGRTPLSELDYTGDRRVAAFFDWLGAPRTILELSSFEGGHTLQLAAPATTERVLGIEGRPENVARARLATELLGRGNTEFAVDDLETVDLAQYGRFEAAFCAGLLYHLVRPWRLLEEIASVSDRLFQWLIRATRSPGRSDSSETRISRRAARAIDSWSPRSQMTKR